MDLLTVVGQRISKVVTYSWPSMEPAHLKQEFLLPGEMTAMHITPFKVAAADIYGSFFLWDTFSRGEPLSIRDNVSSVVYCGSGANGIRLSDDGESVCWSASNPQSGWNGLIGGFASINPNSGAAGEGKPQRRKQNQDGDKKRCITQ